MRAAKICSLLLLLLEAILALAYWAGYHWLGGWQAGALTAAIALLLIGLPWLGDLALEFDSRDGILRIKTGWWGRLERRDKPQSLTRLRLLGIPFPAGKSKPRKKRKARKTDESTTRRPREMAAWAGQHLDPLSRTVLAGMQAAHEALWGAKELRVQVDSPTQIESADQALAWAVGERHVGPIDLTCKAPGDRRVRVYYRVGMFHAALIALVFLAEGRIRQLTGDRG